MGAIRVAEDTDFLKLKKMLETSEGWQLECSKRNNSSEIDVWSQPSPKCNFKIIKVLCKFPRLNPSDVYDVLHDPAYRLEWDFSMIESKDIGHINPNNDVSYYAVTCPTPMKNRDFVLQRSWLDTGQEKYIINHSVTHPQYPPRRDFIRGISHFTGYLISEYSDHDERRGCRLGYISHTDPQGDLPSWLVDKCTKLFAPKYIQRLQAAAVGYQNWKSNHMPNYKPWLHPEQIQSPRLSITHITEDPIPPTNGHVRNSLNPNNNRKTRRQSNSQQQQVVQIQPVSPKDEIKRKSASTKFKKMNDNSNKSKLYNFFAIGKSCLSKSEDE